MQKKSYDRKRDMKLDNEKCTAIDGYVRSKYTARECNINIYYDDAICKFPNRKPAMNSIDAAMICHLRRFPTIIGWGFWGNQPGIV